MRASAPWARRVGWRAAVVKVGGRAGRVVVVGGEGGD